MGVPKCLQMSHRTSFISMIILTLTFFFVEIIVGYATNSMALVADSFHMLSDVVSLFVGFMALRYSKINKQNGRYTFGWARAEVLGALVNAVFLVALCFSIFVEALKRIIIPEAIDNAKLVLITGAIGLFVNIIGLFLFHQTGHGHSHGGGGHGHSHGGGHGHSHQAPKQKHVHANGHSHGDKPLATPLLGKEDNVTMDNGSVGRDDVDKQVVTLNDQSASSSEESVSSSAPKTSSQLNIRGVYLHVLGDALGSVIVMISALIILYANGTWIEYVDPSMSIMLVLIILKTSIPLLKESSMILMQTVPTHLKIQEMQDRLIDQIPGVVSVHEFHVWQLAGSKIIASAHVRCNTLEDYMAIANQLKEFFHNEGIHSTTIQPEFVEKPENLDEIEGNGVVLRDCVLECDPDCAERMCCTTNSQSENNTTINDKKEIVVVEIEKTLTPTEPQINGNARNV
eukprot:TCONS_00024367-protein